ncbi:transposase [Bradyrhizobium sp. Cham227]|nr:transposase [Bradyrhizobium brasilense]
MAKPPEAVYPVVFFDALRVKIRDEGLVKNKAVYVALALNADDEKDVLGLWIEQTEGATRLTSAAVSTGSRLQCSRVHRRDALGHPRRSPAQRKHLMPWRFRKALSPTPKGIGEAPTIKEGLGSRRAILHLRGRQSAR